MCCQKTFIENILVNLTPSNAWFEGVSLHPWMKQSVALKLAKLTIRGTLQGQHNYCLGS